VSDRPPLCVPSERRHPDCDGTTFMSSPQTGLVTGLPERSRLLKERLFPRGGGQPPPGIYLEQDWCCGPVTRYIVPSRFPSFVGTRRHRQRPSRVHTVRRAYIMGHRHPGTTSYYLEDWHFQCWCGMTLYDPCMWTTLGQATGYTPCNVCVYKVRP
jgi:hypothetical protein